MYFLKFKTLKTIIKKIEELPNSYMIGSGK